MNAYNALYPYAVVWLTIIAACATVICGGVGSVIVFDSARKASNNSGVAGYIIAGTTLFVGSCLAAMGELKIGAWIVSISCS
jgi:hypothetical protein